MSRKIRSITNVCSFAYFSGSASEWSLSGGFPTQADEIIVRQITYDGIPSAAISSLYLIQSSINNQIIGSATNISGFTSNPGTVIVPTAPLPQTLTFQMMLPTQPAMSAVPDAGDRIAIHMDFITYH